MKLNYDRKSKEPAYFVQKGYCNGKKTTTKNKISADSKIAFDPNKVNHFMTFAWILEPDSKLDTLKHLSHYYEIPSFSYNHIMRTMDLMAKHYDEDYVDEIIKGFRKYGLSKQH